MAFDSLLMVCAHCTVSTSRPTNAYVRHLPRHPAAHNEKAPGRPSCNLVFHVARPASSSAQIESHKVLRLSVGSTPGKLPDNENQVNSDYGCLNRDLRLKTKASRRRTSGEWFLNVRHEAERLPTFLEAPRNGLGAKLQFVDR
jgi:hypothetical protein